MTRQNRALRAALAWTLGCLLISAATPLKADEKTEYQAFMAKQSPALVTVKFVLKSTGRGGSREDDREITAVMIDAKGLVLCSSSQLGVPPIMRQFGSATPTDIKVLIGDDTEGLEAKLIARDSELDLAWVQIKEPGQKPLAFLDLANAATPEVGHRLLILRKMGKYFDRALVVSEGRVAGKTAKPRELIVPGGSLDIELGLPVCTPDGSVVGIAVLQIPDQEEIAANPFAFMSMGREIFSGLILPTSEVIKATQRARQISAEEEEEDEDDVEEKESKTAHSPIQAEPLHPKQRGLSHSGQRQAGV